jgi:hypothetical protein
MMLMTAVLGVVVMNLTGVAVILMCVGFHVSWSKAFGYRYREGVFS